jgi:hypothetical protein
MAVLVAGGWGVALARVDVSEFELSVPDIFGV